MKKKIILGSVIFFIVTVFVVVNLIGKDTPLCRDENYRINGSVCWVINLYSEHRLGATGGDGKSYMVDLNVPRFIIDRRYASHNVISIAIDIFSKNHKTNHPSYMNIQKMIRDSSNGLDVNVNYYKNNSGYKLENDDGVFSIYSHFPVVATFKYFIPIAQPERQLFLVCSFNCRLSSAYKGVSYELGIPSYWKNDYRELQSLAEKLIDSFIVEP